MADPRSSVQNQIDYQRNRYEGQQNPVYDMMAYNFGRGSEANYGDYTDIMNQYRSIASGGGGAAGGGGGGGGGVATWNPSLIGYKDPFNSYGGFEEFSRTGGYSRDDIANMRARGVSPIRAAYANAEREMSRQRALQGGYSPNAFASLAKMAREQGQLGADATQNVEAALAEARNKGRLSGLAGMSDIEKQRLAADLDVAKFNANATMSAGSSNAGAANAATAASRADQLRALQGMTSLYGTTPAMAATFGNQLLGAVGQSGTFGQGMVDAAGKAQGLPGQYEQTNARINQGIATGQNIAGAAGAIKYAYDAYNRNKQQPQQPIVGQRPVYGTPPR